MRIYRVCYGSIDEGQLGYSFTAEKGLAQAQAREFLKDSLGDGSAEVEELDIPLTRAGILRALNWLAGHAENGP